MNNSLKNYLSREGLKYAAGIFFILMINLFNIYIPKTQGDIIDYLSTQSFDKAILIRYISYILLLALGTFVCNYFARYLMLSANSMMDFHVRSDVFDRLLKFSATYYTKNSSGEIMALSSNDISRLRYALSRGLNMVTDFIILFVLAIISIFTINTKLVLYVILPVPIAVIIIIFFGPILREKNRIVQEQFARLTTKTQQNLSAIRIIKAFVHETNEIEAFEEGNKSNYKAQVNLAMTSNFFNPLIIFVSSTAVFLMLLIGGKMVLENDITLGEFVACNTYLLMLIRPISMLGMIFSILQQGRASWGRITDFFNVPIELEPEMEEEINDEAFFGDLTFENVNFSYDGKKPVLKDIDITIEAGTSLGIIGKIGSGKSTLVNLMLRLYDADTGNIKIGSVNIKDISRKTLRDHIAYVPQDNFLFSETIVENIDFDDKLSIDEVHEAAKISQIHESILNFSHGYNTQLGERGVNLSGGQKQRISIARALTKDAPILILDDCLSAVDAHTEQEILKELRSYSNHRTTLIITHRLTAVEHCDNVIVFDDGVIVESGSPKILIKKDSYYSSMVKMQEIEQEIGVYDEE